MYDFKRILVCLDFSDQDKYLIMAASNMVSKNVADSVYFFHAAKSLELSKEFLESYPTLAAPVDEQLEQMMKVEIDEHFSADTSTCDTIVVEGNPFDQILKWSRVKEIDLVIMGKKPVEEASFDLPERVIKLTHNSVLLVTNRETPPLKTILVPIDFSRNSRMAISYALKTSEILEVDVVCQHIYEVPTGYHSTGKSYEEFAEIMEANARKEYTRFLADNELPDIDCIYTLSDGKAEAQILSTAKDIDAGLIVMGSKGRTQLSNLVLGSTSMKMVKYDFDIPLLIVKDKAKNLGFMDAILKV